MKKNWCNRKRQQLVHMEQFEQTFAKAVSLINRPENQEDDTAEDDDAPEGRLIVFVDELSP